MKVCILIPGFIKSYEHLEYLSDQFKKIKAVKIYIFGHIFNFKVQPNVHKEDINYNNQDFINKQKLNIFNLYEFVSDYEPLDKFGYDSRIFSQWNNIQKSFELYLKYSKEHNIKCDVFVRMRSDLQIDVQKLHSYIWKSYFTKKIVLFDSNRKIFKYNDQLFIGNFSHFQKIITLAGNIYKYYELPFIKKKILKPTKYVHHNRFMGESEILFQTHIEKNININDIIIEKIFFSIKRY